MFDRTGKEAEAVPVVTDFVKAERLRALSDRLGVLAIPHATPVTSQRSPKSLAQRHSQLYGLFAQAHSKLRQPGFNQQLALFDWIVAGVDLFTPDATDFDRTQTVANMGKALGYQISISPENDSALSPHTVIFGRKIQTLRLTPNNPDMIKDAWTTPYEVPLKFDASELGR